MNTSQKLMLGLILFLSCLGLITWIAISGRKTRV